jgi:mannose-6-phosphate isomerase-like protein (cupin superfamily)
MPGMPPDPTPDAPLLLRADEGRPVARLGGETTVVKLEPGWTHGAYALRDNRIPPGFRGVPLHVHRAAEEAFYVLTGTMSVLAGDQRVDAGPGDTCLIPRGTPHALANLTDEPVTWLTLLSPGDQSGWVDDEERLLAEAGGVRDAVDQDLLRAVHDRYGLEILGPPPDWDR